MVNNETKLLENALLYEEGHPRRTQHILKVYALARLFGEQENLSLEEQQILQAAAILHDIPIKYCKEHFHGNASQENQQKAAPMLVTDFLQKANYLPSCIPEILDLVMSHHAYAIKRSKLLQLLMEADLLVNSFENASDPEELKKIPDIFVTDFGKKLYHFAPSAGKKKDISFPSFCFPLL